MVEDKLRNHFDYSLGKVEVVIYSVLALLLSVTVLAAIASAGKLLWDALRHWAIATQNAAGFERIVGCVDAGGDLAHGSHLDSFACSRH